MRFSTALIVLVFLFPASWASNPGEPLDCADWVFLEPGPSRSANGNYNWVLSPRKGGHK